LIIEPEFSTYDTKFYLHGFLFIVTGGIAYFFLPHCLNDYSLDFENSRVTVRNTYSMSEDDVAKPLNFDTNNFQSILEKQVTFSMFFKSKQALGAFIATILVATCFTFYFPRLWLHLTIDLK